MLKRNKIVARWSGAAVMLLCMMARADGPRFELRNERVALAMGEAERGAMVSLRSAEGAELLATPKSPILFALTFSRQAEPPGGRFTLTSRDARAFTADPQERLVTLNYDGLSNWPVRVTCTARVAEHDPHVRWRIAVQVPEGLVLEAVRFPIITLRAPLGTNLDEDASVLGSTKGGLIRAPGAMSIGSSVAIGQPGNMAAQFGCYYQPQSGFFTAAFDGRGHPKNLLASRVKEGFEFSWYLPGFATGAVTQDYDIATTTFSGTGGAPADWRDAADLYKAWALTQRWCAATYDKRADLPAWMKEGPALVRFGRDWLAEPGRIERWLTEYWRKRFPSAPLITAYWGWERIGNWVTPDYFPLFPGDGQFTQLVARSRAMGCHAFPWPSGYHWTLTYQKQADGSFAWDDRKRFDEVARAHAVQNRDGKTYLRTPSWLAGGDTSCMCGGDPWTLRWWNEDICAPLAQRGCEMIQVDQVVGGSFPACFNPAHPHPPGPGRWQTESFARQLQTMRETMRRIQPDAVVCFEEPNEWFNHLVGIQDYRDGETPHERASVFNYLYHEFLPTFQSNPRGDDLELAAHCLVDGQMPHLVPSGRDLAEPVLVNGGFEPRAGRRGAGMGWDQVHSYQGVDWTGKAGEDSIEKYGGAASLRLDNTNKTDIVQVSQNVQVCVDGLAPGRNYRLGAWLKTGHMDKPNAVGFCFLTTGTRSVGQGGQLPFPANGSGWQRVSADFTVPEGAGLLRVMINLVGPARAWVDDMTLEELLPEGGTKPVVYSGASPVAKFMQQWVALYHGEGRPWLQFGRMLHPPPLACASNTYQARSRGKNIPATHTARTMPAVLHNAFRAPDGAEAVVLANPTPDAQRAKWTWHGRTTDLEIPPASAMLVK